MRINLYFDISSKTQICLKFPLRPYCIQPSDYRSQQPLTSVNATLTGRPEAEQRQGTTWTYADTLPGSRD